MNINKFIGIPYEKKNCWDLAVDFYKDILGIELKNYYSGPTPLLRSDTKDLIYTNKGDFEKVLDPKFGDVVLIKLFGVECHLGIVLDSEKFLHTRRGAGSIIEPLNRYKTLITGYYRVKA
jgi:hypothetical protein